DRKSTRLNSSHVKNSYAVFCLKKKMMNATHLREIMEGEFMDIFKFNIKDYKDVVRLIDGHEIMDAIHDASSEDGHEETAIIVRSNNRANLYNKQIRERILLNEYELATGDYFMVVNNIFFFE